MIEITHLTKWYGDRQSLDDVSFTVPSGTIAGLIGPNGAGKTTTLRILTGLLRPTSGDVTLEGFSIYTDMPKIRKLLGYLPENNPLPPEMTVSEFLTFITTIRQITGIRRVQRLEEVIQTCKIATVWHQPIHTLSKGFRQRVGLAQAILHSPQILILDEPTSGLDPTQTLEIHALIQEQAFTSTILLCSHNLREITGTCSRILILKRGKLIAQGSPAEILQTQYCQIRLEIKAPPDQIERTFKALPNVFECILSSTNDYTVALLTTESDIREQLFACILQAQWPLRDMRLLEPDLNQAFQTVTDSERGL